MNTPNNLCIYEELLLLALDDVKGTTNVGGLHETGMGGAVLSELILHGAIRVGHDHKRQVRAIAGVVMDDPLLQEVLVMIQNDRVVSASDWVVKVAGMTDLKKRVARRLVSKGILREGSDKVLGIFRRIIYPESNAGPEKELIARIREAILGDSRVISERTVLIISLAQATDLLKRVCTRKELKSRRRRIREIASGSISGKATKEAMAAMHGAMMVVLIAASAVP